MAVVLVLSDVLADLWQNVDGVGDLVDFAGVNLRWIDVFFIVGLIQRWDVGENSLVVVSELEDGEVVTSLIGIVVSMGTGPVIEVEWQTEYVG